MTPHILLKVFSGVHADIFDVTPSASTRDYVEFSGSTTATAVSIDIVTAGSVGIVFCVCDTANITCSNPTNGYGSLLTDIAGWSCGACHRTWASAGATGTADLTLSLSSDWTIQHFSLKPSAAAEVEYTMQGKYLLEARSDGTT